MRREWITLSGWFVTEGDRLRFPGGEGQNFLDPSSPVALTGHALANEQSSGGTLSAQFLFSGVGSDSVCELILYHDPASGFIISAGLGGGGFMCSVRSFDGFRWTVHKGVGYVLNLLPDKPYSIAATVAGSRVAISINAIDILAVDLPWSMPKSQVGVSCVSRGELTISHFRLDAQKPVAFAIMQFSSPYNQLYESVIRPICENFNLNVIRADEQYGPGLIISDVVQHIAEAHLIIAEISSLNPNVYYEVGYAHALGKDTILLAERSLKLPFDLSPFRTQFYDNTIEGKEMVESGLKKHLSAILENRQLEGVG